MREINISALEDIEMEGVDSKDYPDFVDAFVVNAWDSEKGRYLTEDELDELNDNHSDFVQEQAMESFI